MASVLCSRRVKKVEPVWNPLFEDLYSMSKDDCLPAYDYLWKIYEDFKAEEEEDLSEK